MSALDLVDCGETTSLASVEISVADDVAMSALRVALLAAGLPCSAPERGDRLISDRLHRTRTVDVLLVDRNLIAMSDTVAAVVAGRARCAAMLDEPDRVAGVLSLLQDGVCALPAVVLEASRLVPVLSERERRVWQAVLAGQSNGRIAVALGLSPITVKREVANLGRKSFSSSRVELWAAGIRLGLLPREVRP